MQRNHRFEHPLTDKNSTDPRSEIGSWGNSRSAQGLDIVPWERRRYGKHDGEWRCPQAGSVEN